MPLDALAQREDPALVVGLVDMPFGGEARLDVARLVAARQIPQHQRVVEIVADEAVALEALVGVAGGDRQIAGGHADGQRARGLRGAADGKECGARQEHRAAHPGLFHGCSQCKISSDPPPRARARLRRDADPRQILKPALRLDETLHFRRHRPRIEVVHDKDHDRLAALQLVQFGQQRQPLLAVELVEDLADQRLGLGAFEMSPIRALRAPNRHARPV